jgi:multidrug resistance efflux pump
MAAVSVSHEPACQRLHLRVTTPAEVSIGDVRYRTEDWSIGGFKIVGFHGTARSGDRIPIHFWLDFQGFGVSFEALVQVLRIEGESLTAKFVNLGEREGELLRQFVSAIATGQMASINGVLQHIDRPVTKTPVVLERTNAPRRRSIRRIVIAGVYIVLGLGLGGYVLMTIAGLVTQVNVQTAVTSMPLEQVVSMDIGILRELYVQPGSEVSAGQALFRVENEAAVRNVEAARQELESAQVDLRVAQSAIQQENTKLAAYRTISNDQREMGEAKIKSRIAERNEAKTEFERAKKLLEYGVISRQLYDSQAATLAKHEALVEEAVAGQRITETSGQTVNTGLFFSGNFLVGDLQTRMAEETAARERLAVAQVALRDATQHESQRVYRAPFHGVVSRVFKSSGMTVDRGENLIVLRRAGEIAQVDAYLTQEEAGRLGTGTRGVAFIPAQGKRYPVEVVAVDRTAGFLKEMQTPKLQQAQYTWRTLQERSAYAKLRFVGISPAELDAIGPGLPVQLSIPRKRDVSFSLIPIVRAAPPSEPGTSPPRLWPPQSPLFRRDGSTSINDSSFDSVRRRVIDAADHAVRKGLAPVEIIHSAGVVDKSSPELIESRRALQDADNFALLAMAYKLTGKAEYRDAARQIVDAWARVNKPTGNPIDETRLETFLWGLDLLGSEVENAPVQAWLGRWRDANRNWKFGSNTETNNHKTHHLKILLMLDRLLGRTGDYDNDLADVQRHLSVNLASPDGKSLDYDQRDAMHYHVFDLEAWTEIELITGCCGSHIDRAFGFFERTLREDPQHTEFAHSTAPIDAKRAAAGFGYARPQSYDVRKAARAVFAYATLPGRHVPADLWKAALDGSTHSDLFYEARYYLWRARN